MLPVSRNLRTSDLLNHAAIGTRWLALILVLGFADLAPAHAAILIGKVVSVQDGDTITVLDQDKHQHRIRLAGIDAPERSQVFGTVSREHLAGLVAGRQVTIEWQKRDKYRRIVGKVLIDGRDANLDQLVNGMAWHYRKYAGEQTLEDRQRYASAEQEARSLRRGLWRDAAPIPPWVYRH